MKILEKVILVQFFLFEQQEVRLEKITGIFGPNASGKSSTLDAIQIAMFGGNSRLVALNAQADEDQRTTRSLKSYCLGQYGESPEDRVRDNAMTYITLIWRDTDTGQPLTMGLAISASSDKETHRIEGRYILPGYEYSMSDHLELVGEEYRPREWGTFRHQVAERARALGEELLFEDSNRYMKAAMFALRGKDFAPNHNTFARAFRFGLKMKFDKTVDQIVRTDVLEAKYTNTDKFRMVTNSFKQLAKLCAEVEAKLEEGRKVDEDFKRAQQHARMVAIWNALERMAALEVAEEGLAASRNAKAKAEADLETAKDRFSELDKQREAAEQKVLQFRMEKEAHSAHKDFGMLQLEIKEVGNRKDSKSKRIRGNLTGTLSVLRQAVSSTLLQGMKAEIEPDLNRLNDFLQRQNPLTAELASSMVYPLLKHAEKAYGLLFTSENQLQARLKLAEEDLRDAKAALERNNQGKVELKGPVLKLLNELNERGLHPIPVCDLVRITNPEWQPVIESYLAMNLQALLVSEADERQAFRIYRGLTGSRAVYGAKLALEGRQDLDFVPAKGSVAELLTGENKAAVAYLGKMLNGIQRADTDQEALAGKRTLTKDGMLVSGGACERLELKPLEKCLIGAGSQNHRESIEALVNAATLKVNGIKREIQETSDLKSRIYPISNADTQIAHLKVELDEISRDEQELASKTARLDGVAAEDYVELGRQEEFWSKEVQSLAGQLVEQGKSVGKFENILTDRIEAEALANQRVEAAHQEVEDARQHPDFDQDLMTNQRGQLRDDFKGRPFELQQRCAEQKKKSEDQMHNQVTRGMKQFGEFLSRHHEQAMLEDAGNWRKAHVWLTECLDRLYKTELVVHRDRMEEAYRTSQITFRNDVAIGLHTNILTLHDTMDRLNAVLASCPTFSNGERYRFRRVVRPHLEELLGFVKDIAAFGSKEDLFGAGEMPQAFKELLEDKVVSAGSMRSPLEDYREFFDFEIEILREDPVTKSMRVVGQLSKRLGPGSGGEHRAPLYVIAGAALAAAYGLDRGNEGALRLMLLDEAFNKMDMTNIIATMRYLEQLGLQVVMASPGENLGILDAFLHSYYDIVRDADNNSVYLENHRISEDVRLRFREDLPEFNPDLVQAELDTMRAEQKARLLPELAEAK